MKILFMFRLLVLLLIFHYIWFIVFLFHSYFERKIDKILALDIVHFPNFEISTSL